ncbi:hypothetical protein KFE25_009518 [Diacronema lutheri]|uniref:Glycosyltransferase n=1 Tax=Diacronema lutheri TaxID=2081491 RepID=A0A8J6CDK4_DIALT|nr:hypothetical protein KFE25_009518 [Diacronema lutheri]
MRTARTANSRPRRAPCLPLLLAVAALTWRTAGSAAPIAGGVAGIADAQARGRIGRVTVVSFAACSVERSRQLLALQESVRMIGGNVSFIAFTDADLPDAFRARFAWARDKCWYWIWKPWLLLQLAVNRSTALGDVLVWIDSDMRLFGSVIPAGVSDWVHFLADLVPAVARDNYGGVVPFGRCTGHVEWQYTKPDVFAAVGLSGTQRTLAERSQQVYSGMLALQKKAGETEAFLREWLDAADDPVNYGGDKLYPSRTRPRPGYVRHKNDQSIFSLLIKRHSMRRLPAPYYWVGDTGFASCRREWAEAGYCPFAGAQSSRFDKQAWKSAERCVAQAKADGSRLSLQA